MNNMQETPRTKKPFSPQKLLCVLVLLAFTFIGYRTLPAAPKSVADINANPQVLNGLRFTKGNLKKLNIQNVHVSGLVFDDIQADGSQFKNVTFEKCSFTKVNFQSCRFENVAFKNCLIQGQGDPKDINNSTIFRYSIFKNVLFENTKMNNVIADNISGEGGYVYFRNMREVYPREGDADVLAGSNLHCRIVDSNLAKAHFLIRGDNNTTFYAQNSTFSKLTLQSGRTYIEKCTLNDMLVYSTETMVVTHSVLDGVETSSKKSCYYAQNQYRDSRESNTYLQQKVGNSIIGYDNSPVYVVHEDSAPALLGFFGGQVAAANIHLQTPAMVNRAGKLKPLLNLNLRNVRISGGYWKSLEVDGGNWENVTIEPTVRVGRTKLKNIQAYNLEFPKGEPWKKESEFSLDITRSAKPFDWPEVHVPTPADMGLEWWPSEPGYRPEK